MFKGIRRFGISAVLVLTFLLLAVSCASTKEKAFEVPAELAEYEQYSWNWQVPKDEKLHFFFMATEGLKMSNPDSGGEKWGDCCLIILPDGQTILIDTGFQDFAPLMTLNLKKMGISKIDYFILSHAHSDHAGATFLGDFLIFDRFEIGKIIYGATFNSAWSDPELIENRAKLYKIPVETYKAGDSFEIGGVHFDVYNPQEDMVRVIASATPDVNNASFVFKMTYGTFTALFTGDLYAAQEAKLVELYGDRLDADLLKIPHHGHNTSSTRIWADAVTPKIAVATGNVAIEQMQYVNYTINGSKVLFDRIDGYIHVWSDGTGEPGYETSRQRPASFYDKLEAGTPAIEKLKGN